MTLSEKDLARFWSKVNKTEGCWLWTSQLRGGYGLFRLNGKIVSAHRLAFLLENELDPRLQVCHSCDTPACVRPSHLFQGSAKVNSDDKHHKDRGNYSLTNEQVMDIRTRPLTSTMCRDLAEEFGVTPTLIKRVLTGGSFAWLPGERDIPVQFTGSKLTHEQVQEILRELENPKWGLQTKLAKKYGVTKGAISHINNGRLRYLTDTQ